MRYAHFTGLLSVALCLWWCETDLRAAQKRVDPRSAPVTMARPISLTPPPNGNVLLIEGVPHVQQKPDFCAEACVAMILKQKGHGGDQDWVFDQSGLDPERGRGVYTKELIVALEAIGFDAIAHPYGAASSPREIADAFGGMIADLAVGIPSIVCMRYDDTPDTSEHFRLVLGYDRSTDEVIYHEPAVASGAYRRMPRTHFEKLWPLGPANRPVVIRLPLKGDALTPGSASARPTDADFAQHVRALRTDLPRGLKVVVQKPFVVIGNQSRAMVRRHARRTVASAVDRLKRGYFDKDPEAIIDVWLFGDDASYRRYANQLFGHTPDTPYGYYTEVFNALVMNISTGAGTLIHELVHPFMHANFPEAPPWFNEGLASLYECSTTRDGQIVGLTNWRLRGLKAEIRRSALPGFEVLMAKDAETFYGDTAGDNYAQSRYLLQYLQEQGRLHAYYAAFVNAKGTDPTGVSTLKAILGVTDLGRFQKRWERWVMGLSLNR